jgi:hypothetical protein
MALVDAGKPESLYEAAGIMAREEGAIKNTIVTWVGG